MLESDTAIFKLYEARLQIPELRRTNPESPLLAQSAIVAVEALTGIEDYLEQTWHVTPFRRRRRHGFKGLTISVLLTCVIIATFSFLSPRDPTPTLPTESSKALQPQEWIDLATEWRNQGDELFKKGKGYLNDDEDRIRQALKSYCQSETILGEEPPGLPAVIKERASLLLNDLHIRIQSCEKELQPRQWPWPWRPGKKEPTESKEP